MAAPPTWLSHERYPRILLAVFALFWALLAIGPHDRADWALENGLTVLGIAVLVLTHRALPLSRVSYTLLFLFLCLHTIGAHYTYSLVPYDRWVEAVTGRTFASMTGWDRNHFDRLVHFSYGLLLAYPAREVFLRVADARGFWGYFLPLDVVMATSALYELIEWGAATVFGGDLGIAYLGTQGDQWDAQKDMALASLGAVIAMLVTVVINWRFQRDFTRAWVDSLRVKHRAPLGEDALMRELRDHD